MKPRPDDVYNLVADAVTDVARLTIQLEDPKQNRLGVTRDKLDRAKRRLAELLRSAAR
jgi:hypothetical protein